MALILLNNNIVILNRIYWLFATKFVFSSILIFKTFITRVTFITPSHTLSILDCGVVNLLSLINMSSKRPASTSVGSPSSRLPTQRFRLSPVPPSTAIGRPPPFMQSLSISTVVNLPPVYSSQLNMQLDYPLPLIYSTPYALQ